MKFIEKWFFLHHTISKFFSCCLLICKAAEKHYSILLLILSDVLRSYIFELFWDKQSYFCPFCIKPRTNSLGQLTKSVNEQNKQMVIPFKNKFRKHLVLVFGVFPLLSNIIIVHNSKIYVTIPISALSSLCQSFQSQRTQESKCF